MTSRAPRASIRASGRAGRVAYAVAIALLAIFHAELLRGRLRDLSIAEPAVAARWAVSILLLAAALWIRRRRRSPGGRAFGVLALAVLLLHFAGPAAPSLAVETGGLATLLVAFPAGLVALAARHRFAVVVALAAPVPRPLPAPAGAGAWRLGSLASRCAPRPPPLSAAAR